MYETAVNMETISCSAMPCIVFLGKLINWYHSEVRVAREDISVMVHKGMLCEPDVRECNNDGEIPALMADQSLYLERSNLRW